MDILIHVIFLEDLRCGTHELLYLLSGADIFARQLA